MAHPANSGASDPDAGRRDPRTTEEEQAASIMPQPGLSFRGGFGPAGRDAYQVGRRYRHDGILRSSRDLRVATDNFADPDIVAIFGREARDVSAVSDHSEEAETVYWPDPVFTVVAQRQIASHLDARTGNDLFDAAADRNAAQKVDPRLADAPFLTVIVVHGAKPDEETDPEDAVQRAGRAVAAARETPEVAIPRPGRYRGPIGAEIGDR